MARVKVDKDDCSHIADIFYDDGECPSRAGTYKSREVKVGGPGHSPTTDTDSASSSLAKPSCSISMRNFLQLAFLAASTYALTIETPCVSTNLSDALKAC